MLSWQTNMKLLPVNANVKEGREDMEKLKKNNNKQKAPQNSIKNCKVFNLCIFIVLIIPM